jgi:recombinational DNA repair ATPase RecF
VGPNGCGKSNVVDAIKWVMGEQSMKKFAYEPFNMANKESSVETVISAILDTVAVISGFVALYFAWAITAVYTGGM